MVGSPWNTEQFGVTVPREEYSIEGRTTAVMADVDVNKPSGADSRIWEEQQLVVLPGHFTPSSTRGSYHCEAPVRKALLHSQVTTNKIGIYKIEEFSKHMGKNPRRSASCDDCGIMRIVFSEHALHVPCIGFDISCVPLRLLSRGCVQARLCG